MTSSADTPEEEARFRLLPERTPPEDMTTSQESEPPPEPTMERDPDRDFMLRYSG